MYRILLCSAAAIGMCAALPANAQTFSFDGTRENVNPLTPPGTGRCAPTYFNTIEIAPGALSSTGTSNLGTFTSTQSHCITSPPPTDVLDGEFTYTFRAGDTITGTYTGNVAATGTPGTFLGTENLIITGGTGRFAGATGTLVGSGDLSLAGGNGNFSGTVSGSILAATANASGEFATAVGSPSAALGQYSSAFGAFSISNADRATALGSFAEATGPGATAVGDQTIVNGPAATALGQLSQATAPAATALGHNSNASGLGSTAVGVRAAASGAGAAALGRFAAAGADGATALGNGAKATFAGSTAVGAGAATTAANQVTLGATGSSVRVGDIAASTAAQSGAIAVATVDENGTLGRDTSMFAALGALQTSVASQATALASLDGRVDALFDLRNQDREDFKRGVAAAVAMGQASMPSAPGRTAYVLHGATFRGEFAVGGSILHRLGGDVPVAIGAGFSFAGRDNNAFRLGVAGEF